MDRATVVALIKRAVDLLIKEQSELLVLDVTERSLSHQLAVYIAKNVPEGLDVDVEYNRHGDIPKRLNLPPRQSLDRELRATTVFPDILIHKRNRNDHNLVVLELKKPGESLDYDNLKLRAFRLELGYEHAAHLVLGYDESGVLINRLEWVDG